MAGGKRQVDLKPEDLPDGGEFYRRMEKQIRGTDLSDFPISPIDHIKKRIVAAGWSMGEITARDGEVDDIVRSADITAGVNVGCGCPLPAIRVHAARRCEADSGRGQI